MMPKNKYWRRLSYWFAPPHWQCAPQSFRGGREENQDNYLHLSLEHGAEYLQAGLPGLEPAPQWPKHFCRLAVSDGMGGHRHGREVAEDLIRALVDVPVQTEAPALRTALYGLHEALWQKHYQAGQANPGATLVMADVNTMTGRVLLANVGDSRAYLWRNKAWQCLTFDHTASEFDWREAAAEQEMLAELATQKSNRIMQAMGFGSQGLMADKTGFRPLILSPRIRLDLAEDLPACAKHHADVFTLDLHKGEVLLLASDGLWSGGDFPWPAPSSDLQGMVNQFARLALDKGSQDNVTVLALSCG